MRAAEADVRTALRQSDPADPFACRGEYDNAIQGAVIVGDREHSALAQSISVANDFESKKAPRSFARLDEVKRPLVGTEGKAIGPLYFRSHDSRLSGRGVDAVDIRRKLGFRPAALIVVGNAEGRICEPYGAVAPAHDVVGRVQALALEAVDQHGDRAVIFGPRHPPRSVFTGQQPPLAIASVAIREI